MIFNIFYVKQDFILQDELCLFIKKALRQQIYLYQIFYRSSKANPSVREINIAEEMSEHFEQLMNMNDEEEMQVEAVGLEIRGH